MNEENHKQFVAGVVKILSEHPESGVLLLIHTNEGLITFANTADPLFSFGILQMALVKASQIYAMTTQTAIKSGDMNEVNKPKGWSN
jgi:hypothetical protein